MIRELLLYRVLLWLLSWRQLSVGLLVLAVLVSSYGVSLACCGH